MEFVQKLDIPPKAKMDVGPPDKDYFAFEVSQEEKEWYEELGPTPASMAKKSISCMVCSKQVTNIHTQLVRHPFLGIAMCRTCRNFYVGDGEWEKVE